MEIQRYEKDLSLPLPLYDSVIVAKAKSNDGNEFDIVVGLAKSMAVKLKERSLDTSDEAIQKNTGDRKRFGEGSYQEWYAKERVPFALIHHPTRALAAIVWLGPKPLGQKSARFPEGQQMHPGSKADTENWHSISLRSYVPFRGKGLMEPFARFAIAMYKEQYPDAKLWMGTDPRNAAMIKLGEKLGFAALEEASDRAANWLVMAESIDSNSS